MAPPTMVRVNVTFRRNCIDKIQSSLLHAIGGDEMYFLESLWISFDKIYLGFCDDDGFYLYDSTFHAIVWQYRLNDSSLSCWSFFVDSYHKCVVLLIRDEGLKCCFLRCVNKSGDIIKDSVSFRFPSKNCRIQIIQEYYFVCIHDYTSNFGFVVFHRGTIKMSSSVDHLFFSVSKVVFNNKQLCL